MSNSSDDPAFGEVKRLLRRLEMVSPDGPEKLVALAPPPGVGTGLEKQDPTPAHAQLPAKLEAPPPASAGAVPLLVANAILATATITSLAWYFLYTSTLDRRPEVSPPGQTQAQSTNPVSARTADVASGLSGAHDRGPESRAANPRQVARPSVPAQDTQERRASVSLDAPTRLEIAAGASTRLPVKIGPASAVQADDVVVLVDLPEGVVLTKGNPVAANRWSILAAAIGDLELRAPQGLKGTHELTIELRSRDGERLATAKLELIIQGAGAAPEPAIASSAAVLDEPAQRRLVIRGMGLLAQGQVSGARLIFERAAVAGNADAAIALGDTYDPKRLMSLRVPLNFADTGKATFWYERADELGSPLAKARIAELAQ